MAEVPQDAKFWLLGFSPKMGAQMGFVANLAGIAVLIVGIVSAATKKPIGIDSTSWFLLTIILFIWGLSFWIGAYFGAKEGYAR